MASAAAATTRTAALFPDGACGSGAFSLSSLKPRHARGEPGGSLDLSGAMKRLIRIAVAALLASLTLASSPALAQGHGHGRGAVMSVIY